MSPGATRPPSLTRYVMITQSLAPFTGGVERHVAAVHASLGRSGLPGRIIVLHRSDRPRGVPPAVEWIRFPAGFSRTRILTAPGSVLRLLRSLRNERGSVLHFHDAATMHPFLPFLRLNGLLRRAFITFHGWEGKFPPEPAVVRQRLECERAAAGTMIVGEFIRRWYGTQGDAVTYGGADVTSLAALPPVAHTEPLRAAFVGRLEPDTGLEVILEAFRQLRRMPGAPVHLSVFGSGSLEPLVRREPPGSVTLEPVPADIMQVYRAFPIIFASGYLTMLEALCARRIVFACYDNPLRKDYLTLHPAASSCRICGSTSAVLDGLIDCRDQLPALLARSAPGWAWAQEQSWDRVADAYRSLWSAHV